MPNSDPWDRFFYQHLILCKILVIFIQCISGKYCVGGMEAGDCHAGFICYGGMGVPDPDDSYDPLGNLCPYGYYCPSGKHFQMHYVSMPIQHHHGNIFVQK